MMANENYIKNLFIQIGVGGTGSYLAPTLINYLQTVTKADMVMVDGDILEEKNLLRQGFYANEINKCKAEAVANRYGCYSEKQYTEFGEISLAFYKSFINCANDLVAIVDDYMENRIEEGNKKEIYIISCVDNNMARLRMLVAAHILQIKYDSTVNFIDSGNAEFHGQSLSTKLFRSSRTHLADVISIYSKLMFENENNQSLTQNDISAIRKCKVKSSAKNIHGSIFTTMPNWTEHLNKADFELSCDDLAVSNPQNIATNMMASDLLLTKIHCHVNNLNINNELSFDVNQCMYNYSVFLHEGNEVNSENNTDNFYKELVNYLASPIGFNEVFSDCTIIDNEIRFTKNLPYVQL